MAMIMLDWRKRPAKHNIIAKIHAKLLDIDHLGVLAVELAETKNKRATSLEDVDGVTMWTRRSCVTTRKVAMHEAYVAKFVAVGHEIASMVHNEEPRKIRKLQYILEAKELNKTLIKKLFHDWAVTIGIHPWALGVNCENQGLLSIPDGTKIVCELIPNVFKTDIRKHRLSGREIPIPGLIQQIAINYSPGHSIRAVVVTEHRNIDFGASEMKPYIQDILFLQTGGYPARNLKEFLHLLEKSNKMNDVPFLYFSDHDPHGHHIFLGLKYGSMASSWASSTQVCSKLQWAGPSVAGLMATVEQYGPIRRQTRLDSDPSLTAEAARLEEARWATLTVAKLNKKLRANSVSKDDQDLYRGLIASGILDLEPGLRQEMATMMRDRTKFNLNIFSTIRPRGVELFIVERVGQLAPTTNTEHIAIPNVPVSQVTKAFNNAPSQGSSQVSSSEVTPERAETARNADINMD